MLKQQFTEFSVTEEEGLHKDYDSYRVKAAAAPTHYAIIVAASSGQSIIIPNQQIKIYPMKTLTKCHVPIPVEEVKLLPVSQGWGDGMQFLPTITGTYIPTPYKSDIAETQRQVFQTQKPMHPCDFKPQDKYQRLPPLNSPPSITADDSDSWLLLENKPAVKFSAGRTKPSVGLKDQHLFLLLLVDQFLLGDPSTDNDIGIVDSSCSRSMTGNKEKLDDFVQVKGGIVKFGELQHFNLFSVSQICDKKNKVLFTDTDCLVLTEDFQLPDESQVVLRIPRKCDLYTFSISELQPTQNVTCLDSKHLG
ncbi:hypothetical protein Tco_0532068 [Tanacetum coccineum]